MKPRNKKNSRSWRNRYPRFEDYFSPKMVKAMKVVSVITITLVMMGVVYFGGQAGIWFKASVLDAPMPFDGTVTPVLKVPGYKYWSTQKSLTYSQISDDQLIDLPKYDLGKLQFPDSQLVWGDASQDAIRNAKITYPVVYLGDYKLDHIENVGSHLAVDIKMPIGTPIRAIANGKVVTVSNDSSGFGHHVVIKIINAPDPANPGSLTTLYACFNHMDRIDVSEGQNVLKGQIIGTSGNTGTSTTPHLHFQIDNDQAPWHPYWPFTSSEQYSAGLDFFSAVDAGLGISKARLYTINPMTFVENNMGYVSSGGNSSATTETTTQTETVSQSETASDTEMTTQTTETETVSETTTQTETQTADTTDQTDAQVELQSQTDYIDTGSANLFSYEVTGEQTVMTGSGITLYFRDENNQLAGISDSDEITAELSGVGSLLQKKFTKSDFTSGVLKVVVRSDEVGTATVTLGKTSYQVAFINEVKPVSSFRVETDGYYQKNIVETVKIIALDADGNVAPAVNFSGIVNLTTGQSTVDLTPNQLQASDFKSGTAIVKMIVSSEDPVVIRVQNGALIGESQSIQIEDKKIFTDVTVGNSHYEAIKYLKDNSIISGYSDGSFKPNETVNRAEALKMLIGAFNVSVGSSADVNFSDVDKSAWYASALKTGVEKGIVQGYSDGTFRPANTVNRAEYMKILLATNDINPDTNITKPYNDVSLNDWFAGYAYLTNKMNLLDISGDFNGSKGMTRGEVAETIYRMMQIKIHNLVTYSK